MNRREIRERVIRLLGEEATSLVVWNTNEIHRAIDDAYCDMVRDSGALEARRIIAVTADVNEYTIPDDITVVLRLAYNGYSIRALTAKNLDNLDRDWPDAVNGRVGQPTHWTRSREDYNKFKVYPSPQQRGEPNIFREFAVGGGVIRYSDEDTGMGGGTVAIAESHSDYTDLRIATTGHGVVRRIVYDNGTHQPMDSTFGPLRRLTGSDGNDLEIWGKQRPLPLLLDGSEPKVPEYAQQGICFLAAARLLTIEGEGRNEELGSVYNDLGGEYVGFLLQTVNRKLPEREISPSSEQMRKKGLAYEEFTIPQPT